MGLFASRETGLRWFGVVWWWFGANMAGLRNKNAFKFILQFFILSQKHILGVKKVVWCGLEVVWGSLKVVWGVLGWFGVFPRTGEAGYRPGYRTCRVVYCTIGEFEFYSSGSKVTHPGISYDMC